MRKCNGCQKIICPQSHGMKFKIAKSATYIFFSRVERFEIFEVNGLAYLRRCAIILALKFDAIFSW